MKKSFTFLIAILSCSLSFGQHYTHTALWLRMAPVYTLNKSWALQTEGSLRRQSNPHSHPLNPLSSPLAYACRAGISYRVAGWTFIAWPFCLFTTYPALGKETDFSRSIVREYRPSLLVEWNKTFQQKNTLRIRAGYEYRYYTAAPAGGRWRFRVVARHNFSKEYYGYVSNELFLTGAPAVTNGHPFDSNRSLVSIGRAISKHLSLEAGYQFSYRQRRTLTEFDEEHALLLTAHIRFDNP